MVNNNKLNDLLYKTIYYKLLFCFSVTGINNYVYKYKPTENKNNNKKIVIVICNSINKQQTKNNNKSNLMKIYLYK